MLKEIIGNFFGFNAELELANQRDQAYRFRIGNLEKILKVTEEKFELADKTVKGLLKTIEDSKKPDPTEAYYAGKYPKADIDYIVHETDGNYEIDVRNFFQYHDYKLPTVTGSNSDEKALNALLWVMNNIKYTTDRPAYGFDEYWAFPWQTLKRKVGDCEDGAILLANILMKSNVPYWRVRLNAGSVAGGGHCYVTYCRETDNKFVVLDWCYWPNKKPVAERLTHEEERNYNDKAKNFYVWFSWNRQDCYGKMQTMAGMPKNFKRQKKC